MRFVLISVVATTLTTSASASSDPVELMNNCERIASGRLGMPIEDVRVELQTARVDGSIPVNGTVMGSELTFQCNFNKDGSVGDFWNSKDIKGCPSDLSEADRWLFPGC